MIKRAFDIFFSGIGLIIVFPVFLLISIYIKLDSKGPVFYRQIRVGRNNFDFTLIKFRTMRTDSEQKGLLTVGHRDSRITSSGFFLRKFKLDELPQLINVFKGEMSFVGPRPEVRKYVELYDDAQKKILNVSPGITDVASLKYRNENELLEKAQDPEKYYILEIMPDKIKLNLEYMSDRSFFKDVKIICKTFVEVVFN